MKFTRRDLAAAAVALAAVFGPFAASSAHADPAAQLSADGERSLHKLEALEPRSVFFARHAGLSAIPMPKVTLTKAL